MCSGAKTFLGFSISLAETKYDGERAQIYAKVHRETASVELKFFSNSKMESTNDRHAIRQRACSMKKEGFADPGYAGGYLGCFGSPRLRCS